MNTTPNLTSDDTTTRGDADVDIADLTDVEPGDRVTVRTERGRAYNATVSSVTSKSVHLQPHGERDAVTFARSGVPYGESTAMKRGERPSAWVAECESEPFSDIDPSNPTDKRTDAELETAAKHDGRAAGRDAVEHCEIHHDPEFFEWIATGDARVVSDLIHENAFLSESHARQYAGHYSEAVADVIRTRGCDDGAIERLWYAYDDGVDAGIESALPDRIEAERERRTEVLDLTVLDVDGSAAPLRDVLPAVENPEQVAREAWNAAVGDVLELEPSGELEATGATVVETP
jgi:hypothetical protein